jgi:hypothetical protein
MSEMQPDQWPLSMRPKRIPKSAPSMVPGKSRKATDKQRQFARKLGLDLPDDVTVSQISVLIDAALDKQRESATTAQSRLRAAEPGEMIAELNRRGINGTSMHTGPRLT